MALADHHDLAQTAAGSSARRVALEASAGDARAVRVPRWATSVLIQITDSSGADGAGSVAYAGADGDPIGTDVTLLAAGVGLELRVHAGGTLYLAGPAGGYAYLTYAERRT
jgi:hypothetical protein